MKNRSRRLVPATLMVACAFSACASTASAAPTSVQLRVEGRNTTIFEGPVTTDGKVVHPQGGEAHRCDGTNNGNNPQPGPTPVTALDDAQGPGRYTWAGTYFSSFDDYQIDRVGPDAVTSSEFWGQYVNSQASQVGGCQEIVHTGDEVLWAFDAFSKAHVLKLSAPTETRIGQPVRVRVTDGANGAPLGGVNVAGHLTATDGTATLTFAEPGVYVLKGSRSDSVRSNAVRLCADRPGAGDCTSADKTPPRVSTTVPDGIATARGRSRTVLFSWQASDGADGSGISAYQVEVGEVARGTVDSSETPYRPLGGPTALTRKYFRGDAGSAYRFRVTAIDRANNRTQAVSGVLSIPVDDRDPQLVLSRGWKRLGLPKAWGRTVIRSTRKGATAKLTFTGRRVALIGRRLRKGGRVRITVGGRSRVVSMRGKAKLKTVLFTSRRLRAGRHTIRVTTLSGAPVELDAVAPLP
jgi:hypothetical protein